MYSVCLFVNMFIYTLITTKTHKIDILNGYIKNTFYGAWNIAPCCHLCPLDWHNESSKLWHSCCMHCQRRELIQVLLASGEF